jgi:hypothetical protein
LAQNLCKIFLPSSYWFFCSWLSAHFLLWQTAQFTGFRSRLSAHFVESRFVKWRRMAHRLSDRLFFGSKSVQNILTLILPTNSSPFNKSWLYKMGRQPTTKSSKLCCLSQKKMGRQPATKNQ